MKKLIAVSLTIAGMVLMAGFFTPAHAQAPANDLKPTFISPTPGLYVNGWPPFTVSYPKEWMEQPGPGPTTVFRAGVPRPDLRPDFYLPSTNIGVFLSPLPLEEWARIMMPVALQLGTDIKVLSDKPSQLKDSSPAREAELEFIIRNTGIKLNDFVLMTKKESIWVVIHLTDDKKIGEDLKRIAYSLTFPQRREEPVKVPPDVRAFLDMWCADVVSHDVTTMMAHFSDRFLWSGAGKAWIEQVYRNDPTAPIHWGTISCEPTVTVFESRGDKAYLDGFFLEKAKGGANARKMPMLFQQIVNEHGEWKWFGDQK
jgi:hypothetical protein